MVHHKGGDRGLVTARGADQSEHPRVRAERGPEDVAEKCCRDSGGCSFEHRGGVQQKRLPDPLRIRTGCRQVVHPQRPGQEDRRHSSAICVDGTTCVYEEVFSLLVPSPSGGSIPYNAPNLASASAFECVTKLCNAARTAVVSRRAWQSFHPRAVPVLLCRDPDPQKLAAVRMRVSDDYRSQLLRRGWVNFVLTGHRFAAHQIRLVDVHPIVGDFEIFHLDDASIDVQHQFCLLIAVFPGDDLDEVSFDDSIDRGDEIGSADAIENHDRRRRRAVRCGGLVRASFSDWRGFELRILQQWRDRDACDLVSSSRRHPCSIPSNRRGLDGFAGPLGAFLGCLLNDFVHELAQMLKTALSLQSPALSAYQLFVGLDLRVS